MRVALLTNILAPYRLPAFRALAQTPGWTLRVFVNAQREFDRSWEIEPDGLDVEEIPGAQLIRGGRTLHFPSPARFIAALRGFRPDAVIDYYWGGITIKPTSFLVDRHGRIMRKYVGAMPEQTDGLVADIEAVLDDLTMPTQVVPMKAALPA